MKWTKSDFSLFFQWPGVEGMLNQIERVGRICYKSVGTRYYAVPEKEFNLSQIPMTSLEDGIDIFITNKKPSAFADKDLYYISIKNIYAGHLPEMYSKYEIKEDDDATKVDYLVGKGIFKNLTAKDFVSNLIENGHYAMLEHGNVFLTVPVYRLDILLHYIFNKYTRIKYTPTHYLITTNYRVVVEHGYEDDLKFFKETDMHYERPCVKFIMDRAGSQSVERHRGKHGISFAQESTRFCNYSKDKFGNELTFIIPEWMRVLSDNYSEKELAELTDTELVNKLASKYPSVKKICKEFKNDEKLYIDLTTNEENKFKAEDARGVLPLLLKTEFVMTAFTDDWRHFFDLRCDSHAHPDLRTIARQLKYNFDMIFMDYE